jgi:hypothetical protein
VGAALLVDPGGRVGILDAHVTAVGLPSHARHARAADGDRLVGDSLVGGAGLAPGDARDRGEGAGGGGLLVYRAPALS